jgi:uncharacterized surface protein with fasciclin (FAS1) repeats
MTSRTQRQAVKRSFALLAFMAMGTAIALPVTAGSNQWTHNFPGASSTQPATAVPSGNVSNNTAAPAIAPSAVPTTPNADADRVPPVIRVSPRNLSSPAVETTPTQTTPTIPRTTPTRVISPQSAPSQTIPAQAGSVQPSPAQTSPAQTTVPLQTAPAQTAPAQTAPGQSTPRQTPRQTMPAGQITPTPAAESNTVVDVAASNEKFKTLVAALKEAELTQILKGDGPFTVFAPTDAAFEALPPGTLEDLLKPENRATLIKVLTYHVVPGKVTAAQLRAGEVRTVEGSPVTVAIKSGKVTVNGANVTQSDIMASNGVIHMIDKVILPGL